MGCHLQTSGAWWSAADSIQGAEHRGKMQPWGGREGPVLKCWCCFSRFRCLWWEFFYSNAPLLSVYSFFCVCVCVFQHAAVGQKGGRACDPAEREGRSSSHRGGLLRPKQDCFAHRWWRGIVCLASVCCISLIVEFHYDRINDVNIMCGQWFVKLNISESVIKSAMIELLLPLINSQWENVIWYIINIYNEYLYDMTSNEVGMLCTVNKNNELQILFNLYSIEYTMKTRYSLFKLMHCNTFQKSWDV